MSRYLRGLLAPRTGRVALPAPAWAAASAAGAGVREPAGQREVDIAVAAVEHNLTLHAQRSLDHQRGAHLGSDRIDRPHRAQLRPAGTDLCGSARRAPACPRARDFYLRRRWKPACKQSGGTHLTQGGVWIHQSEALNHSNLRYDCRMADSRWQPEWGDR